MKRLRLFDLLNRFSHFISADSFDDAVLFIRHSDVLNWISMEIAMKPEEILMTIDTFRNAHLPDTLEFALPLASSSVGTILGMIMKYRKIWLDMTPVQAIGSLLSMLYGRLSYAESSEIPLEKELETFKPYLRIMNDSPLFSGKKIDAAIAELLEVCGDIRFYREPRENEFFISGFLELPWSDAERIILVGMNEEYIPENVSGSTFLSDSMRMKLGLQCNARRKGRDTLYLESLLNSRGAENMRFLAAASDQDGKPLKLSSLLFQCGDQDLIDRSSVLFDHFHFPEKKASQTKQGFILSPDFSIVPDLEDIIVSVTQFRIYLKSPFRFFLTKFMKMDQTEYDLPEMDRPTFGTICHSVIEDAGRVANAAEMKRRIQESLERRMIQKYGSPIPVLPAIQMEQMKQRLLHAAGHLAQSASEFTVLETEYVLGGKQGYVEFEGGKIQGRIDCIEYSSSQNLLRLIDFKTSDKGESPEKVHYQRTGNKYLDLQLPLYRLLIERDPEFRAKHPEIDFSKTKIICGYFNMPRNVLETGYSFWDDMEKHLPAVTALVNAIFKEMSEMRSGVFYEEENRRIKYDAFDFCIRPSLLTAVPSIKLKGEGGDHE